MSYLCLSGIQRGSLLPVRSKLPKEVMWGFNREIVCRAASFLCSKCGWNHRGSKGVIHCHCGRSNIASASIACTLLTTAGRPRFRHKHPLFELLYIFIEQQKLTLLVFPHRLYVGQGLGLI